MLSDLGGILKGKPKYLTNWIQDERKRGTEAEAKISDLKASRKPDRWKYLQRGRGEGFSTPSLPRQVC